MIKTKRDSKTSTNPGLEPFLGTWILVSSITDGQPAPEANLPNVRVVIADGRESVWLGDQVIARDIPFTIDLSVTPHHITDTLPNGQQIKGITRVEGDILTSCVALVDQDRPAAFVSIPGMHHTLRVFKRLVE